MRVVVKEPGRPPEIREIEKGLDAMQAVVKHGTYNMIEHIEDAPDGLDLWANEEGKYAQDAEGNYLPANIWIFGGADFVMGTVFIAGATDDGDTRSLEAAEVARAIGWLNERALKPDAARAAEAAVATYFR